jgi:hypothetical protein
MHRPMHQRDLARHASTLRAADLCGGVSAENIRALNEAFHTAMTGGPVFLIAALTRCPPTTFAEFTRGDDLQGEHDFGNSGLKT